MIGNFHVRFLGGKGAVMPPTYPAKDWIVFVVRLFSFVVGVCLPRMSAGKTEGSAFGFYCTE